MGIGIGRRGHDIRIQIDINCLGIRSSSGRFIRGSQHQQAGHVHIDLCVLLLCREVVDALGSLKRLNGPGNITGIHLFLPDLPVGRRRGIPAHAGEDFLSGIGGSEKHHAANEQKNQKNGKDHAHFRPVDRVLLETLALNTARWSRVDMRDLARAGLSVDGGTVDAVHGQAIILGERFTLCVIHILCCIHGDLPGRGGAGCRVHPGSACALALKGDRRL